MGSDDKVKNRRPFLLWLICLILAAVACIELSKVVQTVTAWNVLIAIQYQWGPFYPLVSGVFFFFGFLAAAVLLWLRLDWAPLFAGIMTTIWSLWYWLDRLALSVNPQPVSGQVFNIIVSFLFLALILGSLWSLQPSMKETLPPPAGSVEE
jgi:hypothetical protein